MAFGPLPIECVPSIGDVILDHISSEAGLVLTDLREAFWTWLSHLKVTLRPWGPRARFFGAPSQRCPGEARLRAKPQAQQRSAGLINGAHIPFKYDASSFFVFFFCSLSSTAVVKFLIRKANEID